MCNFSFITIVTVQNANKAVKKKKIWQLTASEWEANKRDFLALQDVTKPKVVDVVNQDIDALHRIKVSSSIKAFFRKGDADGSIRLREEYFQEDEPRNFQRYNWEQIYQRSDAFSVFLNEQIEMFARESGWGFECVRLAARASIAGPRMMPAILN